MNNLDLIEIQLKTLEYSKEIKEYCALNNFGLRCFQILFKPITTTLYRHDNIEIGSFALLLIERTLTNN